MAEDDVLLRLYRAFSKEEAIAMLKKEISSLQFINGELVSEIDELKFELHKQKNITVQEGLKTKKVWAKDELITMYDERFKSQRKKNNKLEKDVEMWRNQYFSLRVTYEKLLNREQNDNKQ